MVPPFHPNRVRNQVCFRRSESDELLYREEEAECIHFAYDAKPDSHPRRRALRDVIGSGICLWYGSRTRSVDRGSLLVYQTTETGEQAWYVGFLKRGEWKIELAKGISPEKVMQFASPDESSAAVER
jgi:hypothetical protein